MEHGTYRGPTPEELEQVEEAFNEFYPYGDHTSLDGYPVVVVEEYRTSDGTYEGRLAVVVDGGANSTTYGFDDGEAFMLSDALNEQQGADTF